MVALITPSTSAQSGLQRAAVTADCDGSSGSLGSGSASSVGTADATATSSGPVVPAYHSSDEEEGVNFINRKRAPLRAAAARKINSRLSPGACESGNSKRRSEQGPGPRRRPSHPRLGHSEGDPWHSEAPAIGVHLDSLLAAQHKLTSMASASRRRSLFDADLLNRAQHEASELLRQAAAAAQGGGRRSSAHHHHIPLYGRRADSGPLQQQAYARACSSHTLSNAPGREASSRHPRSSSSMQLLPSPNAAASPPSSNATLGGRFGRAEIGRSASSSLAMSVVSDMRADLAHAFQAKLAAATSSSGGSSSAPLLLESAMAASAPPTQRPHGSTIILPNRRRVHMRHNTHEMSHSAASPGGGGSEAPNSDVHLLTLVSPFSPLAHASIAPEGPPRRSATSVSDAAVATAACLALTRPISPAADAVRGPPCKSISSRPPAVSVTPLSDDDFVMLAGNLVVATLQAKGPSRYASRSRRNSTVNTAMPSAPSSISERTLSRLDDSVGAGGGGHAGAASRKAHTSSLLDTQTRPTRGADWGPDDSLMLLTPCGPLRHDASPAAALAAAAAAAAAGSSAAEDAAARVTAPDLWLPITLSTYMAAVHSAPLPGKPFRLLSPRHGGGVMPSVSSHDRLSEELGPTNGTPSCELPSFMTAADNHGVVVDDASGGNRASGGAGAAEKLLAKLAVAVTADDAKHAQATGRKQGNKSLVKQLTQRIGNFFA